MLSLRSGRSGGTALGSHGCPDVHDGREAAGEAAFLELEGEDGEEVGEEVVLRKGQTAALGFDYVGGRYSREDAEVIPVVLEEVEHGCETGEVVV